MSESGRCVPCDDGRRLLIAAVVARLAWGLATRRLAADAEMSSLAPWAALAVSCAAPVLAYRLAINLRLPRAAALAAGVLLAVHPALVDAGTRGGPEAALPGLAAACLVAWVYAWQSGKKRAAALAGICGGAAAWAGAAVLPAAAALAAVAIWRRKEQRRWKMIVVVGLIFGAVAAGPRARIVRSPAEPFTKWSAPMAVTPAGGHDSRGVRVLFSMILFAAALFGLRAVASGPGGWFAVAWLLSVGLSHLWLGAGPRLSEDPALAVFAGAGLCVFGLSSD
ncbi:MAG: hypothetical protein ACHQ51_02300 [Elusimicrobiota bacterium]